MIPAQSDPTPRGSGHPALLPVREGDFPPALLFIQDGKLRPLVKHEKGGVVPAETGVQATIWEGETSS
jgi:hypothetical protein